MLSSLLQLELYYLHCHINKDGLHEVHNDGSYTEILTHAVTLVLKSESFSLPVCSSMWRAQETAEKLLKWSG